MSKNFFAALDDSDNEGAPVVPVKKEQPAKKPVAKATTGGDTSKPDPKRRPNHNDRNTKFGRGGRAPARDGKRAYDRRSGTGRGKETKKGGGGARNWGSDKNEARQAEGHVDEAAIDNQEPTTEDKTENEEAVVEEPEPEPEPEDNTMTYEEYLESKKNSDALEALKGKERDVVNEFEGLKVKPVQKADEEDFFVAGGGKQKKNKQKKNETKTTITPAFRVKSSNDDDRRRDAGGRGGRGRGRSGGRGGRDGRGRGRGRSAGRGGPGRGGRGGRGLNAMDPNAFPTLS